MINAFLQDLLSPNSTAPTPARPREVAGVHAGTVFRTRFLPDDFKPVISLAVRWFCAVAVVACCGSAFPWSSNPAVNDEICTVTTDQVDPQMVSDGSGGAIITWSDGRNGNMDIYAQRINSNGVAQWTTNGVTVCNAAGAQITPQLTTDGLGGAIITWTDSRSAPPAKIRAQRINSSGVAQWTTDGIELSDGPNDQENPQIATDGSGGAIISWQDEHFEFNFPPNIFMQRVNSNGALLWPAEGVNIDPLWIGHRYTPRMIEDGLGGVIIVWLAELGDNHIETARIDPQGDIVAFWQKVLTTDASSGPTHRLASDGSNGAIFAWQDVAYNIYAQRMDSAGTSQWTASPFEVCPSVFQQTNPDLAGDGSGGAIIAWEDNRNGNTDIYAQRIDTTGTVIWQADGDAICTSTSTQYLRQVIGDDSGGAIITWLDERNGGLDIYAQRVNSNGAVQWTANGIPITTAAGLQLMSRAMSDGSGGAFIAWMDPRNGNYDIYASRIGGGGTLVPVSISAFALE